jgi:hypothetical protein
MPERRNQAWRKSSYCNDADNCVEVALVAAQVGIRDSKAPAAGDLRVSSLAWHWFLDTANRPA